MVKDSTENHFLKVAGKSMYPYLIDGDLLAYKKGLLPKVGDLVIYQVDGKNVVHRYLGGEFIVKGDNLKRSEVRSNIIGVIKSKILKDGSNIEFDQIDSPLHIYLNVVISIFSKYNDHRYFIVHRVCHIIVKGLGRALRRIERNYQHC